MTPEQLMASLLVGLFSGSAVGPGGYVYHATPGIDPLEAYCTYTRGPTEYDRDLGNLTHLTIYNFDVTCSAKFANVAFTSAIYTLDQTYSNGYFVELADQHQGQGDTLETGESTFSEIYTFKLYLCA
jgi:hypothetical protein